MNDISLTIRLPLDLYNKLDLVSKEIGFTKVTFIRIAIYTYLVDEREPLIFQDTFSKEKHRLVLNVNQQTYELLLQASSLYGMSVNSVVTALVATYLKFFSRVLPELNLLC